MSSPPTDRQKQDPEEGRQMLSFIRERTAVLHWREKHGSLPKNGSAFFVRTEKALFGVTAKHVYQDFAAAQDRPICILHNQPINIRLRLIAEGKQADVATFEVLPDELAQLGLLPVPWPPFLPPEGKSVLVAGYPGIGKRFTAPGEVTFGIIHALTRVDSVNSRDLSMVRMPDNELQDLSGNGLPPRYLEMGGMSGGPVITPILEPSGEISYALSGVIYECGSEFEILKAVRADIIDETGSIHG